jgi:hypothetical protein
MPAMKLVPVLDMGMTQRKDAISHRKCSCFLRPLTYLLCTCIYHLAMNTYKRYICHR